MNISYLFEKTFARAPSRVGSSIQRQFKRTPATVFQRLFLVLLLGCSAHALAQSNLDGYWEYKVPNGGVTFFSLKQTGETLIGTEGDHRTPFTGTIHDNNLHLASSVQTAHGTFEIVYDGVRESADKFEMSRRAPGVRPGEVFETKGVLERVDRDVVYPSRLSLPPLADQPDNGLARTPPMGWNSWNHYHDRFDDATVRETADAIVSSGMAAAGYQYIVVDEGWSSSRDADGHIVGNARFPDMKALADYVHSKGLKIGIYSSPGAQVCGGYQGSYGHEEQDAKTFAAWGYDYLKYDWCGARRIYQRTPADLQGAYQKMSEALAKSGRPIVYSLCEYGWGDVWRWGAKSGGNLWRTTGDIADNWESMNTIGFAQLDIAQYAGPGHWNDPDMLEVGNGGMTADEYRTHMSLWALLRAPLIAGNDLRTMTEETKSILINSEVIAIDQDPLALPVQRTPPQGTSEVLIRPLADEAVAVGLFNRGSSPAQIGFRWDSLHLNANLGGKSLEARDLWRHEAIPVTGDAYTATVPSHGVVLIRVAVKQFATF
jgi:alpha-galactosidase